MSERNVEPEQNDRVISFGRDSHGRVLCIVSTGKIFVFPFGLRVLPTPEYRKRCYLDFILFMFGAFSASVLFWLIFSCPLCDGFFRVVSLK